MADQPSITIIKTFPYRGLFEEFSNSYHFSGTVPTTTAEWKTLADAIILAEKSTVPNYVQFIRAYGYVAGNDNSVAQIDYAAPGGTIQTGNLSITATTPAPGDAAVWIRWLRAGLNSRGKKVYLRKYMHGVRLEGDGDTVSSAQRAAMLTFAGKMIDGTLPGGFTYDAPQGGAASAPSVGAFVTTRTLKRRGKRLPTTP